MIQKDTVVTLHYRLSQNNGELVESTFDSEPMAYIHGNNHMIDGFEQALEGKDAGDIVDIELSAADAYGERREDAIKRVPVKHLAGAKKWKKGMIAHVRTEDGMHSVTVVKVGRFMVDVDTNHPLAGKDLSFHVEILELRDATAEELAHGHVHQHGQCAH